MGALQHITIPNSTLRRFLNDNNEIFYLDVNTKEIKKIPVDLNGQTPRVMYNVSKKEVFSDDADEYIKTNVENKLGEAFVAIDNLVNGGKSDFRKSIDKFENICKEYKDLAIKAVAIQAARNPNFAKKLGFNESCNLNAFQVTVNKYFEKLEHLIFNIAIIHKKNTTSTFVLPDSHCIFYGDNLKMNCTIFIPLSPYYALTLMDEKSYEKCIIDDVHNCVNLKDDLSINCINNSAFLYAKNSEPHYLIAYKKQLEFIKRRYL